MNSIQSNGQCARWLFTCFFLLVFGCSNDITARRLASVDPSLKVEKILVSSDNQSVAVVQTNKVYKMISYGRTVGIGQFLLRVYDIESGLLKEEVWLPKEVIFVEFSAQLTHLLTLSLETPMKEGEEMKLSRKVELRDMKGNVLQSFDLGIEVGSFGFAGQSSRIWAATKTTLSIWSDFDPLHVRSFVDTLGYLASFSRDGNRVCIFSSMNYQHRLIDLTTQTEMILATNPKGGGGYLKAQFSYDGNRMAVSSDEAIVIWDVENRTKIWDKSFKELFSDRPDYILSPNGKQVIVGVNVFDIDTGLAQYKGLRTFSSSIPDDGSKLLLYDRDIQSGYFVPVLFDMKKGDVRLLAAPKDYPPRDSGYGVDAQFSPNGHYVVAIGGVEGKDHSLSLDLLLWDIR